MNEIDEIKRLKGEVEYLKGEISQLYHLLNKETHSASRHINELYKRVKKVNKWSNDSLANLYDIVMPIEERLFPSVSKARQALTNIIEKADQDKNDDSFGDPSDDKNS
jgi:hypothetical protein